MSLIIQPIEAFSDNYIWLPTNTIDKTCICIDPGDATPVLAKLHAETLSLKGILITHHHWDHTGGVAELLEHYNVPVYGPAREYSNDKSQKLKEGDTVTFDELGLTLNVLDIPGHTLGHIAYYTPGILFCGDTLFAAGCGRVFEGTPEQMYASLCKLAELPDDTLAYCAHEYSCSNLRFAECIEPDNPYIQARIKEANALRQAGSPTIPTTLQTEKRTNPFLRCHIKGIHQAAEQYSGTILQTPADVFAVIRRWKDVF